MNTFLELQTELQNRLSVSSTSTFFTLTKIKSELSDAHIWAGSLFNWPMLRGAKSSSSVATQDYYDIPPTFRPDSIWQLEMDGKEYERKDFNDFLDFRRNNPTETKKIFANYGPRFFIFPTPTATGTNNIDVWGFQNADPLVLDTDKTFLSDYDPAGNEAILKRALDVLTTKGKDKKTGQVESLEAEKILASIYKKILEDRRNDQNLDHPMFDVPDFIGAGISKRRIANF